MENLNINYIQTLSEVGEKSNRLKDLPLDVNELTVAEAAYLVTYVERILKSLSNGSTKGK